MGEEFFFAYIILFHSLFELLHSVSVVLDEDWYYFINELFAADSVHKKIPIQFEFLAIGDLRRLLGRHFHIFLLFFNFGFGTVFGSVCIRFRKIFRKSSYEFFSVDWF